MNKFEHFLIMRGNYVVIAGIQYIIQFRKT